MGIIDDLPPESGGGLRIFINLDIQQIDFFQKVLFENIYFSFFFTEFTVKKNQKNDADQ